MEDPRYHAADVLKRQLAHVENELAQLEMQKKHLQKTLAYYKGEVQMNDQEKFETWKQQQLSKNEKLYGKEIRKHYGDEQADRAQQHWGKLSAAQYQAMQGAESELLDALDELLAKEVELPSPLAEKAFQAHRRWLMLAAPDYTPAYHRALAQMYAADERFAAYYPKKIPSNCCKKSSSITQRTNLRKLLLRMLFLNKRRSKSSFFCSRSNFDPDQADHEHHDKHPGNRRDFVMKQDHAGDDRTNGTDPGPNRIG